MYAVVQSKSRWSLRYRGVYSCSVRVPSSCCIVDGPENEGAASLFIVYLTRYNMHNCTLSWWALETGSTALSQEHYKILTTRVGTTEYFHQIRFQLSSSATPLYQQNPRIAPWSYVIFIICILRPHRAWSGYQVDIWWKNKRCHFVKAISLWSPEHSTMLLLSVLQNCFSLAYGCMRIAAYVLA